MQLYDYYRSSSCYRVRIALQLKQLDYETIAVNLTQDQQHQSHYKSLNPQALVPTLIDNHIRLTQSLAIIEYLNEVYPHPPLLPGTALERAAIRSLANIIACDIHPLNNLRVLNTLRKGWHATEEQVQDWYHAWLKKGFSAIEKQLANHSRTALFCFAEQATMADICLIPQVYNAKRFELSLDPYPIIRDIYDHCLTLPAFIKASP